MREFRLPMYGVNAINQDASQEEVAAITAKLNTPEHLSSIINSPKVITRTRFGNGTDLVLLHPTGPYSDRALMLAVYDPNVEGKHKTQWIYDYSRSVQEAYWQKVVCGLMAARQILRSEGRAEDVESLYMENSTHVSNGKFRTSRTIRFPHGHFVEIDPTELIPHTSVLHHLKDEREVLERGFLLERFTNRVGQEMEASGVEAPHFELQDRLPLGYRFSFPGYKSYKDIESIATVMASHHAAAEQVANKYKKTAGVVGARFEGVTPEFIDRATHAIDPPSYRLYMSLGPDGLNVIISPEFISHAGTMQAKGIDLDRSEAYPMRVSPLDRAEYASRFAGIMSLAASQYV